MFLEFQKKASELERLSKLVVAWDWTQLESRKSKGVAIVQESERKMKECVTGKARMAGEIKVMLNEVTDIEKRRDKELAKGGKVQRLEEEQKVLAKECTKLEAKVDIGQGNLKEEEDKIVELESSAKEVSDADCCDVDCADYGHVVALITTQG